MDSRMNSFKGGADGMTRDKYENLESFQQSITSFQGQVTRSRARKIEEECKETTLEEFKAIKGKTNPIPHLYWSLTYRRRQVEAYHRRARSKCYKDGGYDGSTYIGSHLRNGHYTHRSQMEVGNFSSRAKTYDHIPYNDCGENSLYDIHKGYHGGHDYKTKSCSFVLDLDTNSLQYACTIISMSGRRHNMELEGQDGLLVPNKTAFVISMKNDSNGTLLYHLPFKEFLKKFVYEEEFGKPWDSKDKQSYTFFDEFLDFMSNSSWEKGLAHLVLDNLFTFNSILGLYVDNILKLSFGFANPCELKSSWNFKKNFDWMRLEDESFQRRGRWYDRISMRTWTASKD
ncbi:hypothetical protein M9H77_17187 [Catharanthus roseus]|uniref:Uncharacterized protein n=1 Tax=Catharanthus roseus TaxID=4058 RepID=A0ACC0B3X0_CATRO|nr:hypothetical protein M9H77_17187 [Catharanthus roseus]